MLFQDGLFIESKAAYQMQLVEDQKSLVKKSLFTLSDLKTHTRTNPKWLMQGSSYSRED